MNCLHLGHPTDAGPHIQVAAHHPASPNGQQHVSQSTTALLPVHHSCAPSPPWLHSLSLQVSSSAIIPSLHHTPFHRSGIANCSVSHGIFLAQTGQYLLQRVIGLVQHLWSLKHHKNWIITETRLSYPVVAQSRGDLVAVQGVRGQDLPA